MTSKMNTGQAEKPLSNLYRTGSMVACVNGKFKTAAAGDLVADDMIILTDGLSIDARVHRIMSYAGNKAGAADCSFIFVEEVNSTVDGDGVLVREFQKVGTFDLIPAFDFTAATSETEDLLAKNTSLDRAKTIKEHLALTDSTKSLHLAILVGANATATAALDLDIMIERATTA